MSNESPTTDPQVAQTVPVLNIANVLTVVRIILVPIFIWLMLMEGVGARWWALAVFCVAAFTDFLDGYLARSMNLITDFGKIADPIADKALVLSAFVLLSVAGALPWWVTALIVLRELGITLMRILMLSKIVIPASKGGKLKTVLQIGLIIFLLIPWDTLGAGPTALTVINVIAWLWIVATLLVTLLSGGQYVWNAWKASRSVQ
ncbi:MAG: CDP-diacylglycerol--glycerol-3-phosphate 3-phosphatidyltransferase [Actinomycetaceae bacterium]|nr:CDP-diacylglycerol--glycerol-3-phosphate 3-phosphatidyltransferase [Actinomycetaceae bacterium]